MDEDNNQKKETHQSGSTADTVLIYGVVVKTNSLNTTQSGFPTKSQLGCNCTACPSFTVKYALFSGSQCATCMKNPVSNAFRMFS